MKYTKRILLTFFIIFSAACLALFFLPKSWVVYGPVNTPIRIVSITIVRYYDALGLVAFVLAIICALVALVCWTFKTTRIRLSRWWLVPLALYPWSCTKYVFDAPWKYYGTVKDKAGNEYRLLNRHFLQGDSLAIGRLKARTWFLDKFEVLADASGAFDGTYLYIVRLADAPDAHLQLYLTEKNWLVGLAGKNRMHLAYDLNLSKPYARSDVLSLSPFILIGDGTHLKQTDCNQILELGIRTEPGAPSDALKRGQPRESVIKEALDSRNPEVRELAGKLISTRKVE